MQTFTPSNGYLSRNPASPGLRQLVLWMGFAISLVTCGTLRASEPVLLSFTSDHCSHCVTMRPTLAQLESNGMIIRHINVDEEPGFAQRYGIRNLPTYIVWSGGKEISRHVGTQTTHALTQAMRVPTNGTIARTAANVAPHRLLDPARVHPAAAANLAAAGQLAPAPSNATLQPAAPESVPSVQVAHAIQTARAATVRLRVRDQQGFGVGTGTIIDQKGADALVITCGHLFRDNGDNPNIEVDLFIGGQTQTVSGQLLDFDSEVRDIALVVIQPGMQMTAARIAPMQRSPQNGESIFSFGCDHGADPSRRDSRITGVNKYDQHLKLSNIEIAKAPVNGRSGGGLFNMQGELIGVCNAADPKGDVGLYTGPGSIKWQLDRVNLGRLYQTANPVASVASAPATAPAPVTAMPQPSAPVAMQPTSAIQFIVADPNARGGQRTVTIDQPSDQLLRELQPYLMQR